MQLRFSKMHGLGNDFIVFDAINQRVVLTEQQIRILADRHFGVGCDQLLLVEKPVSENADFKYRIFNADGSEVSQCGNGARCFARFVREKGLSNKDEVVVDTNAGQLRLTYVDEDLVSVNMGVPRHAPWAVPLRAEQEALLYQAEISDATVSFSAVSMGNPHAVLQVANVDEAPVANWGKQLESHPIFPERANIGFMQVLNRSAVRLRVYERGAAETLACGSGACAAVVAGIELGVLDQQVKVSLPGGDLKISWQGRGEPVFMSGPAVTVFEGLIEL
ncbi:MAG: diaminopimelate epimerase [Methylococcaceae bacterium]|nr:diaminopimelate epimerase [Methylococcaceae bacterium]